MNAQEMFENEIWKDLKGYEGHYQISNFGRVKSLQRYKQNNGKLQFVEEKIIKTHTNKRNGYVYAHLCKESNIKNKRVHRLVLETFVENKENLPAVNHIDGNRSNNNLNNLEWCSIKYNVKDGLIRNGAYKNDLNIIKFYQNHKNCSKTAKEFNMTNQGIQAVLKRNGIRIYSNKERAYMVIL